MGLRRTASVLSGVLLTSVALTYALWDVDFGKLITLLGDLDYLVLIPFLSLLTVFFLLKALRWTHLLRPLGHYTTREVIAPIMIGFGANNVLPARLGELLRIIVFARRFQKPYSGVLATVVLERIMDASAILLLYFVATLMLGEFSEPVKLAALTLLAFISVALLVIVAIVWRFHLVSALWRRLSERLPDHLSEKGEKLLHNLSNAMFTLRSARAITLIASNSVLQWGIMTLNIWLSMWAFGAWISLEATLFVMVVTALAVSVPSVPGYVGPIQAAFVFALSPFGVSQEAALAGSVFFLVGQWVPVTAAGALCFVFSGLDVEEVRREAEHIDDVQASGKYEESIPS